MIYDRILTSWIAASLPLGSYAEPAADRALDGPELERVLRLALDGWSVIRLVGGEFNAGQRIARLRRIAERLRDAGVAAGLPVHLVGDMGADYAVADTSLGDLAGVLDAGRFERPVTAIFATRRDGAAPLYAIVDNGLAG